MKHGYAVGYGKPGVKLPKTYTVWREMRARCQRKTHKQYADYGGRGITVCPEWDTFSQFLTDMGEAPEDKSLDRRDNNMGYSRSNCRWATTTEQSYNTRANTNITCQGVTRCLSEWASVVGLKRETISWRLRHGWDAEKSLFTKLRSHKEPQK